MHISNTTIYNYISYIANVMTNVCNEILNINFLVDMQDSLMYDTSKQNIYSLLNSSLTTEQYLDVINWKRHVKSSDRFRCNNHNVAIERQRGILSREHRICKLCNNLGRSWKD